jgi:hypothetical protein
MFIGYRLPNGRKANGYIDNGKKVRHDCLFTNRVPAPIPELAIDFLEVIIGYYYQGSESRYTERSGCGRETIPHMNVAGAQLSDLAMIHHTVRSLSTVSEGGRTDSLLLVSHTTMTCD